MDFSDLDPELREVTMKGPSFNLEKPFVRWAMASLSRFTPGKQTAGVERRLIRDGGVRLRLFIPRNASGAGLLWMHGGELVLGSAATDDAFCGETAVETGTVVVSVDYRLAPRHPFPEPLDDCYNAYQWMLTHAGELGLDSSRFAIGGQSAGGGLAAALVQRLHDDGQALAAQWLFCPMLDDRTAADRSLDSIHHFVWNNRSNLVGWRAYLGDAMGASALPAYAAPARRSDLTGLPRTWLYSSDIELFHAENLKYV